MRERLRQMQRALSKLSAVQVLLLILLTLAAGFLAQSNLDHRVHKNTALLTLGVAAVLYALLMRGVSIEAPRADRETPAKGIAPSIPVLAAMLGLSVLGCLDFGGDRFRLPGLLLWIGGLALVVSYLWLLSPARQKNHRQPWWRVRAISIPAHWVLLLAIVLVGLCLRFWLITEIPADLGGDLPNNYWDAMDILKGNYSIFFPAGLGREGMFFYLIALLSRLVGLSRETLHLTSAVVGTLTIIAFYALGREAFNRASGLLGAFLLAVNHWHLALSRSGFRVILMPLFTVLTLYTLLRALRRQQWIDFAWAGLALGASFYTYKSSPFLPLVTGVGLVFYFLGQRWRGFRRLLPGLVIMACVTVVVAMPIARAAIEKPNEYFAREANQFRAIKIETLADTLAYYRQGFLSFYWASVLGFNYVGDMESRWNIPFMRHMGFISGVLMVLGLAYALLRWRHGYNVFLLSCWFIMLLPPALSILRGEPPGSFRMSGTLPPAVLFAALPLDLIVQRLRQAAPRCTAGTEASEPATPEGCPAPGGLKIQLSVGTAARNISKVWYLDWAKLMLGVGVVAVALVLGQETRDTTRWYFHDFVQTLPDRANYSNAREVARVILRYGDLKSAYIRGWPGWFDGNAFSVCLRCQQPNCASFVDVIDPGQPPLSTLQGAALFLFHPDDQDTLNRLRQFLPHGVLVPRYYPDGDVAFYTYYAQQ
jgi:4-amino-4-deoxy-L-arabinose transferase-like glycosyltransferase